MKALDLETVESVIVFNNLCDEVSEDWLDEDLVFIRLGNGTKLEAGWYPDESGGHFKAVHYRESWSKPLEVIRTTSVRKLRDWIEQVCVTQSWMNRPQNIVRPVSNSSGVNQTYVANQVSA